MYDQNNNFPPPYQPNNGGQAYSGQTQAAVPPPSAPASNYDNDPYYAPTQAHIPITNNEHSSYNAYYAQTQMQPSAADNYGQNYNAAPPAYPAYPAQPTQKGGKTGLFVGLGIGAVALIAGVVVLVLFLTGVIGGGGKSTAAGLPGFNGAERIELTQTERQQINTQLASSTGGGLTNSTTDLYLAKGDQKTAALDFYERELKNQGWTTLPTGSSFNSAGAGGKIYVKGDKATIVFAGPVGTSGLNSTLSDSRLTNADAKDTLILIITGDADFSKSTTKN